MGRKRHEHRPSHRLWVHILPVHRRCRSGIHRPERADGDAVRAALRHEGRPPGTQEQDRESEQQGDQGNGVRGDPRRTGQKADKTLAKDIGLGALTFSLLKADVSKDSVFVLEDALNFDGETAPYVMYTHARCASILAKAKIGTKCNFEEISDSGWELVKFLNNFNSTVLLACEKHDPSVVTKYAISLATLFNKFYHDTKIICEDADNKWKSS